MKKVIESIFLYGAVALITFAAVYAAFGLIIKTMAPESVVDTPAPVVSQTPEPTEVDERDGGISAGPFAYSKAELVYEGEVPVYVTVYSHNEDSWKSKVSTPEKYAEYRTGLIERAELLAEYGVSWNWQTDQPVVEAMIAYEDNVLLRERTQGLNVLEYLTTLGVKFDPHAHTNNYADIVYLLEEELGVEATNVIGGTIHIACGDERLGFLGYDSWMKNVDIDQDGYVYGRDYPEAKWKPEVLSDPGMGGHYYDEWHSGVWKPGDENAFYLHFPEKEIVYIGEGYPHDNLLVGTHQSSGAEVYASHGQYLKELTRMIDAREAPTGTKDGKRFMYTASIHVRDTAVVQESEESIVTAEGLETLMEELQPMVERGKIVFVDFEEAVRIWEEEYDSVPWKFDLTEFSFYEDVRTQAEEHCESRMPER